MCYELQESTQRGQEDTGAGSETQGWCMCENSSLVWEADIATEAIRYLDVMLNMLPLSLLLPSRSVSVSSPPPSQRANSTLWTLERGKKRKCGRQSFNNLLQGKIIVQVSNKKLGLNALKIWDSERNCDFNLCNPCRPESPI